MINNFANITVPPDDGALTTVSLAAGTTSKTSGPIDLLGATEVSTLEVKLGTVTATGTGTAKLQYSDDAATWVDIGSSSQAWDDTMSGKTLGWSIAQVTNRYIRVSIARATANTAITYMAAKIRKKNRPTTQVVTGIQFAAQPLSLTRTNQ